MTPSAILSTQTGSSIRLALAPGVRGMLALLIWFGAVTVAAAGPFVYVTHLDDDTVSVIDAETQTVIATVDVGARPELLAAHPAGTVVYVSNSFDGTISAINTATNGVVATIGSEALGISVMGMAMHPDGSAFYAAGGNRLFVIETATHTLVDTIEVAGDLWSLAVHPMGTELYATDAENQRVLVIDPDTRTVTTTVQVDVFAWPIAGHPDGTRLYVPEFDPTIAVIDTDTHTVIDRIPFDPDGTAVVTELPGGAKSRMGGIGIQDLALHPAGTFMYVLGSSERHPEGEVLALDLDTQTIVERIPVAANAFFGHGLAIHPDGSQLYVASIDEDMLSVIDMATHTISATVPVGRGPWDVAVAVPGVRGVAGCVTLDSLPLANRAVVLKQKGTAKQRTTTDAEGCYTFPSGRVDRRLELILKPLQ